MVGLDFLKHLYVTNIKNEKSQRVTYFFSPFFTLCAAVLFVWFQTNLLDIKQFEVKTKTADPHRRPNKSHHEQNLTLCSARVECQPVWYNRAALRTQCFNSRVFWIDSAAFTL
ncbi:hypothetical protein ATANTOWER_005966 [Ataeniobius toweri]|uniref:Uncharacterized protein n=1 Tax=Ataeniobius toweri TaxID=208326 RepID=A0ABU7CFW2_9TELE|nr:hypothetical protein [Ataeniobius toweri]